MSGGRFAQPVRRGQTVVRQAGPPNSRALLQHLADAGFELAPRFLGTTDDGTREILSFVPGTTGYPPLTEELRSDEALVSVARAVRRFHDAGAGFVPPHPGEWRDLEAATPVRIDCVGHHDLAPWNLVFDGSQVAGIIDWDSARPSNRAWDLSYAAHQFVPFHPPAWLEPFGWPTEPDRAARLRLFCESYGNDIEPAEILDLVVIRLTAFAAHQAGEIRAGNPAYAVHAAEDHPAGFRASAQWILEHRAELLR
jgi:Ser/Thr protein kinase RdoA (MazF antagonist)